MAMNLRDRFGPKDPDSRRLLGQEFEFSPSNYPSLLEFAVERDDVELEEKPLAVTRSYVLARGPEGVQLQLALCLRGPGEAFDLLFHRASSFQREPDAERAIDVSRKLDIGDGGVGWQWDDREPDGVLGFVRFNVLVFMRGRFERLQAIARELDADLSRRETRNEYTDSPEPLFTLARAGGLEAAAGSRLDLGRPQRADSRYFFVATGGSVNRDPSDPGLFYYRAGLAKGSYSISAWRVGKGLLPDRQTIPVRII
jgi:hypothetical protein